MTFSDQPPLLHTLYLAFPKLWEEKLYSIYKDCANQFNNEYLDDQNWRAHLTIGTWSLPEEKTDPFVQACHETVDQISPFWIELGEFTKSENGEYVFLELNHESREFVTQLHSTFFHVASQKLDHPTIPQKYLDRLDEFNADEHARLRETGSPYEYQPHISIVKIKPHETDELLAELNSHDLTGARFLADTFNVSRQSNDPENKFPVIERIRLTPAP